MTDWLASIGWLLTAFMLLMAIAAFGVLAGLERLPRFIRLKLFAYFVGMFVLVLVVLLLVDRLSLGGLLKAAGLFLGTQYVLWGFVIWTWQRDAAGDPTDKAARGEPQFEGRDSRYWERMLSFSPVHIVRYHLHLVAERREAAKAEDDQGNDGAGTPRV